MLSAFGLVLIGMVCVAIDFVDCCCMAGVAADVDIVIAECVSVIVSVV